MAEIKAKIGLPDGSEKTFTVTATSNSKLKNLCISLDTLQKQINTYLTEVIEEQKQKQVGNGNTLKGNHRSSEDEFEEDDEDEEDEDDETQKIYQQPPQKKKKP